MIGIKNTLHYAHASGSYSNTEQDKAIAVPLSIVPNNNDVMLLKSECVCPKIQVFSAVSVRMGLELHWTCRAARITVELWALVCTYTSSCTVSGEHE